jgi:DNA replicative helicase MCM subunit Mcm2 (Cdc46/Mcm family)
LSAVDGFFFVADEEDCVCEPPTTDFSHLTAFVLRAAAHERVLQAGGLMMAVGCLDDFSGLEAL